MLPDKIAKPNPKYRARRKHREQFQAFLGRIAGRNPILGRPLVAPEIEHGFLFLSDEQQPVSVAASPPPPARSCPANACGEPLPPAPAPAAVSVDPQGTAR